MYTQTVVFGQHGGLAHYDSINLDNFKKIILTFDVNWVR